MATREYFSSQTERNKFLLANKDEYVQVQTHGPGGTRYGVEKRVLTETEAKSLGYSTKSRSSLQSSGRIAPTPIESMVGTPEDVKNRLLERYETGAIHPSYSAKIVQRENAPHAVSVTFQKTPKGEPSVIRYSSYQNVAETSPMPEGQMQYAYSLRVDTPEQAADVRTWASSQGYKAERIYGTDLTAQALNKLSPEERREAGKIEMRITSNAPLPENATVDIRSKQAIEEEKAAKLGRVAASKIYEKASIIEKPLLHVRTLLSPAGYGYVGAAAREYGGPVEKALIDLAFPGVKSTKEIVIADIGERTSRHALGKTTYNIMGVEVPEAVVSAIHNPVVDVEMMFLGGAGAAKVAATKTGAKILGSTAGKALSYSLSAAYIGTQGVKIAELKSLGKETEALGTAITAAAGLGAAYAGAKTQFSHIIKTRAHKAVEIDISEVKGGSLTKKVGKDLVTSQGDKIMKIPKGSTVSRGKFQIAEGKLKGLRGETFSVSGKKSGKIVTHIPQQTLKVGGKTIKVQAQTYTSAEKHGTLSDQLKIYWRKTGDMSISLGKKIKLIGPKKGVTLTQQVSSKTGTATFTKKVPGGKIRTQQQVTVRKYSGVSLGKQASKYDLYLVQQGSKLVMVEKAVLGSKSLAKVDWVDVQIRAPTSGAGGAVKIGPGVTKVTPGTSLKVSPAPAIPPATLKVKIDAATSIKSLAKIVPNVNPVPMPVRIKRHPEAVTVTPIASEPTIIRRQEEGQKGRTVLATKVALVKIPDIQRPAIKTALKTANIELAGTISIPATHPITGQPVSQKERTAVLKALEPIIDRVPSQPIIATPTPNIPPKIILPFIPGLPFEFKFPSTKFKKQAYGRGVITNPIPEIEKVI